MDLRAPSRTATFNTHYRKITGIHVELFPETASKYSAAALNEIYDVLTIRARADALALEPPTFPYTDEECEELIDILERSKDHASSPHTTAYVARLWATVVALKVLLFGLPDEHRARFENLCVDRLIYTSRWREHVAETVDDLKQERSRILIFFSANILMMRISSFPSLTKLSLIFCTLGLTVTLLLLQQQRRLVGTNTTTSSVHTDDWITCYGFQPIAIVHSLPQALFVWALLLFAIQHYWMAFAGLPLTFLLSASLPVAAVLLTGIYTSANS
ncbi:hypothetical protein BJY52DRAFT_1186742 [Lactarius psammicola]|nr:hypothetical protein BJY52DRAFT_1186742 [Lactarius psammicola]